MQFFSEQAFAGCPESPAKLQHAADRSSACRDRGFATSFHLCGHVPIKLER
jgi:hypothetical protein